MSQKTLSIIVKAVDQATAPLRGVATQVVSVGDKTAAAGARVQKTLDSISGKLSGVMGIMLGFASFQAIRAAFNALSGAIDHTTQALEDIGNASERLQIPVETLSKLRYAAKLSEMDFGTLADAVKVAETNITMFALTGGGKAADSIKHLGLSIRDASGQVRGIGEMLPEIFDAIAALPASEQGLITTKLFGTGHDNLLLMIRQGGDELRRLGLEAERLGVVFSPAQVEAAQKYRDAVDRISEAWLGLKAKLVTEIAPALTDFVNKAAVTVASIVDIVKNVFAKVHEALDPDSAGGIAARMQIGALMGRIMQLVSAGMRGSLRIAAVTLVAGIPAIVELIYPIIEAGVGRIVMGIKSNYLGPQLDKLLNSPEIDAGTRKLFRKIRDSMAMDNVDDRLQKGIERALSTLNASLSNSESNLGQYRVAWQQTVDEISGAAGGVSDAFRNAFGVGEALARHALPTLAEVQAAVQGPPIQAPEAWSRFFDAIGQGVENVRSRIQSATAFITDLTEKVLDSFSSSLSNAIVDAVSGVKSFGEAVRDVASQVLRMIAQMILQWTILRTITGLFGGVGGGGASTLGEVQGPPLLGGLNRGGMATRHGVVPTGNVLTFAGGGMVPGPRIDRDIIPALLTPGEGVLSRLGMARLGRAGLDHLNNGGGVGGNTVNISVVVHAPTPTPTSGNGGGGVTLAAIQKAAADGVLEALRRSPDYRGKVRAFVGGVA